MNVHFGQIYVEVGASFAFSFHLQQRLGEEVTNAVKPSSEFSKRYGDDWSLMFRISAKTRREETEIHGPTVFRKTKEVEYSVFLAFDALQREANVERAALVALLRAVCKVLERYAIQTTTLQAKLDDVVQSICADRSMFSRTETE